MSAYKEALTQAHTSEDAFVSACGRILIEDEWFPPVARIIELAREWSASRPRPMLKVLEPNNAQVYHPPDITWKMPRLVDGRPDLDEWYRQSRDLRGLDRNVDMRQGNIGRVIPFRERN